MQGPPSGPPFSGYTTSPYAQGSPYGVYSPYGQMPYGSVQGGSFVYGPLPSAPLPTGAPSGGGYGQMTVVTHTVSTAPSTPSSAAQDEMFLLREWFRAVRSVGCGSRKAD
jgi:hypothetical protein